jgi:ATP-dependent helicase/nuclease subunit B
LQLDVVLSALNERTKSDTLQLAPKEPWALWARMLDRPDIIQPIAYPEPRPPVAVRPQQLPVTSIGLWLRNPYAIYAKYILKLKKLEPLEREAGAAERGTLIHETLEIFLKRYPHQLPANAETELISIARDVFKLYDDYPEVMALWWPKLEKIAAQFVAQEQARREAGIMPLALEIKGRLKKNNFTLTGRVDRIDRLPDGRLAVIDYKTGQPPSVQNIEEGLEPQLPLLALMVEGGGFEGVPAMVPAEVGYWRLKGGSSDNGYEPLKIDLLKRMREAEQGLHQLIAAFAHENTPYLAVPNAEREPHFDDYAHLARLAEWGRTKEGE